jgi:hypothetical protein
MTAAESGGLVGISRIGCAPLEAGAAGAGAVGAGGFADAWMAAKTGLRGAEAFPLSPDMALDDMLIIPFEGPRNHLSLEASGVPTKAR